MPLRKKRRSTKRSKSRKWLGPSLRIYLLLVLGIVVAILAVGEYLQEGGKEEIVAWLDRVTAQQVACSKIDDAVDGALVRLMAYDAETTSVRDSAGALVKKTARLPGTVPLAEANLEIASSVRSAGGKVINAMESRPRMDAPGTLTMSLGTGERTCCEVVVRENREKTVPSEPFMLSLVVNTGDDLDLELLTRLIEFETEIGVMILPYREHSASASKLASRKCDILTGIPMEPAGEGGDWGEGSILSSMSDDELTAVLSAVLESVPDSKGAVLFLDSPLIHDSGKLREIVGEVGKADDFLVDATLNPYSDVRSACRRKNVELVTAMIHLNPGGKETVAEISNRLHSLIRLSKRHGKAVGMCNLTPALLVAIGRGSMEMKTNSIEMVRPSELMAVQG